MSTHWRRWLRWKAGSCRTELRTGAAGLGGGAAAGGGRLGLLTGGSTIYVKPHGVNASGSGRGMSESRIGLLRAGRGGSDSCVLSGSDDGDRSVPPRPRPCTARFAHERRMWGKPVVGPVRRAVACARGPIWLDPLSYQF